MRADPRTDHHATVMAGRKRAHDVARNGSSGRGKPGRARVDIDSGAVLDGNQDPVVLVRGQGLGVVQRAAIADQPEPGTLLAGGTDVNAASRIIPSESRPRTTIDARRLEKRGGELTKKRRK